MKRVLITMIVAALAFGAAVAQAGQGGNCSPEGTWYGDNNWGYIWIVTISRSGPKSFTTVMDNGANPLSEDLEQSTDWRGELVKTGPHEYDWTTMAYWRVVAGAYGPFPLVLGLCPASAEFTSCDSWQAAGYCEIYGYFPGDDPFADGIYLGTEDGLLAQFKRMPMSFPE